MKTDRYRTSMDDPQKLQILNFDLTEACGVLLSANLPDVVSVYLRSLSNLRSLLL